MSRLHSALEEYPSLTFAVAIFNWIVAGAAWFVDHADDIAKVFALVGAVFGMVAAYYAMRLNRRNWRRGETSAPFIFPPEKK